MRDTAENRLIVPGKANVTLTMPQEGDLRWIPPHAGTWEVRAEVGGWGDVELARVPEGDRAEPGARALPTQVSLRPVPVQPIEVRTLDPSGALVGNVPFAIETDRPRPWWFRGNSIPRMPMRGITDRSGRARVWLDRKGPLAWTAFSARVTATIGLDVESPHQDIVVPVAGGLSPSGERPPLLRVDLHCPPLLTLAIGAEGDPVEARERGLWVVLKSARKAGPARWELLLAGRPQPQARGFDRYRRSLGGSLSLVASGGADHRIAVAPECLVSILRWQGSAWSPVASTTAEDARQGRLSAAFDLEGEAALPMIIRVRTEGPADPTRGPLELRIDARATGTPQTPRFASLAALPRDPDGLGWSFLAHPEQSGSVVVETWPRVGSPSQRLLIETWSGGEPGSTLTFTFQRPPDREAAVRGVIVDPEGRPLEGMSIRARPPGYEELPAYAYFALKRATDSEGRFASDETWPRPNVSDPETGELTLSAMGERWHVPSTRVDPKGEIRLIAQPLGGLQGAVQLHPALMDHASASLEWLAPGASEELQPESSRWRPSPLFPTPLQVAWDEGGAWEHRRLVPGRYRLVLRLGERLQRRAYASPIVEVHGGKTRAPAALAKVQVATDLQLVPVRITDGKGRGLRSAQLSIASSPLNSAGWGSARGEVFADELGLLRVFLRPDEDQVLTVSDRAVHFTHFPASQRRPVRFTLKHGPLLVRLSAAPPESPAPLALLLDRKLPEQRGWKLRLKPRPFPPLSRRERSEGKQRPALEALTLQAPSAPGGAWTSPAVMPGAWQLEIAPEAEASAVATKWMPLGTLVHAAGEGAYRWELSEEKLEELRRQ